jgi:DNA-binding NarL/FixJ family response regulator
MPRTPGQRDIRLVIADRRRPRLDGATAVARITSRWPSIRVIVLGLSESGRAEALAAGADEFISKHAPVDEVLRAVHGDTSIREAAAVTTGGLNYRHGIPTGGCAAAGVDA